MPNARTDTASQAGSAPEPGEASGESSVQTRYDGWAPSYDVHTSKVGWCAPSRLLSAIAAFQRPAAHLRVVDLGVGTGQASAPYLDLGARVTGLDLAPSMLEAAAAVRPGFFRLVAHDLARPFDEAGVADGGHDLVLGCGVLHFVEDLGVVLRRCAGLLDAGGLLAFTYIPPQARELSSATHPRRPETVRSWLVEAGLEVLADESFTAYVKDDGPVLYRLCLARDPRPARALCGPLGRIDRTACVDRGRLHALAETRPWTRPPTRDSSAAETGSDLLQDLEAQVRAGELDLDTLGWPVVATARGPRPGSAVGRCDVLAVFAHPDDESLYAGETIAALAGSGHRVHLLVLTDGAGGRRSADEPAQGTPTLADVRRKELGAAAVRLGIAQVEVLDFADFGKHRDDARTQPVTAADTLARWGTHAVVEAITTRLRRDRPRAVLSFSPDRDPNYSLHGHHLATGVASAVAVALFDAEEDRGTTTPLWAAVAPEEVDERGVSFDQATWRRRKIAAIAYHRSQSFSSARTLHQLSRGEAPAEGWYPVQGEGLDTSGSAPHRLAGEPAWSAAVELSDHNPLGRWLAGDRLACEWFGPADEASSTRVGPAEVVTGQQVGLFGGPALTLHKALGAMAEARRRGGRARFWMATQDHDLGEVSGLWVPHAGGQRKLRWSVSHDGRPVGGRVLDERVTSMLDEALASVADSPGRAAALDEAGAWIRRHYVPGRTMAAAFAGAMAELLPNLEVLDPRELGWARRAVPLYAKVLDAPGLVQAHQRRRDGAMRLAGVPGPVQREADCLPVFVEDEAGRRQALRWTESQGFSLGGRPTTVDELRRLLDAEPARFSPDALLRPAVQDAIVGATHYVGGPNELAYWAQATALHEVLGVDPARPVLRPQLCVLERAQVVTWSETTASTPAALAFDPAAGRRAWAQYVASDAAAASLEGLRLALDKARDDLVAADEPEVDALRRIADHLAPIEAALRSDSSRLGHTARQLDAAAPRLEAVAEAFAAARPGSPPSRRPIGAAVRTLVRLERAVDKAQRGPWREAERIRLAARPRGGSQDRAVSVLELVARHGLDVGTRLLPEVQRQMAGRGQGPRAWVVALDHEGASS